MFIASGILQLCCIYAELLVAYSCPIVMMGDVNIELNITDERYTRQFNDVLESFGLIQSIKDPTHLHGRILDVVITRLDLPPPLVQVGLPGEYSDHALLVFPLNVPRPPVCFTNISTRAWRNFDENKFLADLQASPLCSPSILLSELSVDELQELYDSTLVALVDRHAPRRTTRRRHQPTTPWFDSECAAAKRKVRMYERQYRRTNSSNDRNIWCNQTIDSSSSSTKGNKANIGIRKFRTVKVILRNYGAACPRCFERRNLSYRIPRSSVQNGSRKPFKQSSTEFVRQLRLLLRLLSKVRVVSPISRISSFLTMLLSDVSSVLLHANSVNSILHPHGLSRNMLTSCLHLSSSCSTLHWPSGLFPTSQKCASVTPALKKVTLDPFDLGNYRPISNLTFVSKLLEHAAQEQIVGYASENQLLPDTQSAYQKHRSTETATLKVLSDVYEAADSGKLTLLDQLDLSAAFDTVDHQILLGRLRHSFGISGTVLDWIASHLTGRTQFVRFNGQSSKTVPVTSGVPQRFGSWADPLPHLYCRSRTRGPKAWFQRPCICGRPANLRSHSSIGHGWPAATNGRLYRGCLHLDVFESTMPQSLEDRTHLVGIITTASELCHGHRNERSGISHSSGRLGQRSWHAHR